MPSRLRAPVVHPVQRDRTIDVVSDMANQQFLAGARHVNAAVPVASIGLRDTYPARSAFVAFVVPVPDEQHLDPIQVVGIRLLSLRTGNDGRFEFRFRLFVFEGL